MDQDPNASSASPANTSGFPDNTAPAYQLAMQAQIMQWIATMQYPYATQFQNTTFSQQTQQSNLSNGVFDVSPMQQNLSLNHPGITLSASVVEDVFRVVYPVGSSPNDDNLLAQALHDSAMNGKSYRQAIEELHGINNHPAHLWKDYYLDHRPRINILVSRIPNQYSQTVKQPFAQATFSKDKDSSNVTPTNTRKTTGRQPLQDRSKITGQRKPTGRMTINSITAHPPPNLDPPSREPSPPSHVVASSQNGNLFTPGDTDFMLKFISWELQRNPALNKTNLSHNLEDKAPHHPSSSWMQHIRSAGPTVDKMIAVAHGENNVSSSEEDGTESNTKVESDVGWQSGSNSGAIIAKFDEDSDDDEINMGLPGKSYTAADRRLLAKYIATVDNWEYKEDSVRFANFHQRYPHRALRSWSRYYSRNERGIDRLAVKYKQRIEESVFNSKSHGRPSWASSNSSSSLPSALKRKFGNGEFEADRLRLGHKLPKAGIEDLDSIND